MTYYAFLWLHELILKSDLFYRRHLW